MAFIDWSSDMEHGLREIDHQHRWMVETANQLFDEVMRPEPDRAKVEVVLGGLQFFIRHHFAEEERLLQEAGYPDLAQHQEEHERVKQAFGEWCREQQGGRACSKDSMPYLRKWLLIHIQESDAPPIAFLISQNGGVEGD